MKTIWVEKYRPKTISEYVFKDESQKRLIKGWVSDRSIPHLLFSGSAKLQTLVKHNLGVTLRLSCLTRLTICLQMRKRRCVV